MKIAQDKQNHFWMGMAIASSALVWVPFFFARGQAAIIISSAILVCTAIAKEVIWDLAFSKGKFEFADIFWTIIGGAIPIAFALYIF